MTLKTRLLGNHPLPWTSAQQDEARHLLRAILRQATYLPDSQARKYIASHALGRFRDYLPHVKPLAVLEQRRDIQVKKGRKALSELKRANAGELKPLVKILHLTYGRIGKRRRELLKPLLPVQDSADGPPTLPSLNDKLKALLLSQMRTAPPPVTRPNPRTLTLKLPELNTWERPMPRKRVANMTQDWYASMLHRVVSPLPEHEWERLRRLALGLEKFRGTVLRRSTSNFCDTSSSPLENELGLAPITTLSNPPDHKHGHTLTASFMRRRWASVFAQCPLMSWESESGRWRVEWGSDVLNAALKVKASSLAAHTKHDLPSSTSSSSTTIQ